MSSNVTKSLDCQILHVHQRHYTLFSMSNATGMCVVRAAYSFQWLNGWIKFAINSNETEIHNKIFVLRINLVAWCPPRFANMVMSLQLNELIYLLFPYHWIIIGQNRRLIKSLFVYEIRLLYTRVHIDSGIDLINSQRSSILMNFTCLHQKLNNIQKKESNPPQRLHWTTAAQFTKAFYAYK